MTIIILFLLIVLGMGWTSILFPKYSLGLQFFFHPLVVIVDLFRRCCSWFFQVLTPTFVLLWMCLFVGTFSILSQRSSTSIDKKHHFIRWKLLLFFPMLFSCIQSSLLPIWYRDSYLSMRHYPKNRQKMVAMKQQTKSF